MVERFDLVGADRRPLGRTAERGTPLSDGEYHVVVMALMVNPEEKILVTKRSQNKTEPGKWECTAGEDAISDIWEVPVTNKIQELVLQTDEVAEARSMTVDQIEWIIESEQATSRMREILTIVLSE